MMNMEFLNYLKKAIMKGILHVFWFFPVEKGKITLMNELSYTYGDNLKYLDKYIHENAEAKYRIVFPLREDTLGPDNDDTIVRPNTRKYFKEVLTSEIIITNAGGVSYLPKRKGQIILSTWHGGGPYKKTSTDVYDNYWYRKEVKMNSDNTDFILSSCKYFTIFEAKSMGYQFSKCIPSGSPRNDIMFEDHTEIIRKVKQYYSIPDDTKLVLYAPTFRSAGSDSASKKITNLIDVDVEMVLRALRQRFHDEWIFAIRLHPKLADVDISGIKSVNCTTYPDMQELLYCADAVISDYSSLIWDYSFTYKPCFLYAPDIEQYEKERGFYMPAARWPFPLAHNNEELERCIIEFDPDDYKHKVKAHHEESGSFEKGDACKTVIELIESETEIGA